VSGRGVALSRHAADGTPSALALTSHYHYRGSREKPLPVQALPRTALGCSQTLSPTLFAPPSCLCPLSHFFFRAVSLCPFFLFVTFFG